MNDPYYDTVFAGIAPGDATDVPTWYKTRNNAPASNAADMPAFTDVLGEVTARFGAETTEAYYYDDERGEYVEIPHRSAVVNPAWLGDGQADAPATHAAWTTASDRYEPVTASEAYAPLRDAAHERDLGDAWGSVECYRRGGEAAFEIAFNDLRHSVRGTDRDLILGFETGYDHYARSSIWATLLAYDAETGACLRGLSERYTRRHRGENVESDLREFYLRMLDRVENLDETLRQVVAEAREYEVPLYNVPLTVPEFYDALGFPASWGEVAESHLSDTRTPSGFDLWLAMSETITSEFGGKRNGDALRNHATRVNDLLYSPGRAEKEALEHARQELAESGQATLDGNDAAETLTDRIETLDDGVEAFETVRERFRTMLDEADESDEQADESEVPA